ncbi:hypothetical protein GCM10010365_12780 [Streptomyces poonensis]|uniref:Uncharacterized protein n=1 Tax=Streptomyces poonensis TaxID=68255 RepID=A0A918PB25_9ACTN|nr:hypothetical protein GCM10010365_12780 [Streptomyces poonensis]GLJ88809.1 hypothetical protein GCM10017589_14090 [Streptomyces poonensis]
MRSTVGPAGPGGASPEAVPGQYDEVEGGDGGQGEGDGRAPAEETQGSPHGHKDHAGLLVQMPRRRVSTA